MSKFQMFPNVPKPGKIFSGVNRAHDDLSEFYSLTLSGSDDGAEYMTKRDFENQMRPRFLTEKQKSKYKCAECNSNLFKSGEIITTDSNINFFCERCKYDTSAPTKQQVYNTSSVKPLDCKYCGRVGYVSTEHCYKSDVCSTCNKIHPKTSTKVKFQLVDKKHESVKKQNSVPSIAPPPCKYCRKPGYVSTEHGYMSDVCSACNKIYPRTSTKIKI